MFLGLERNAQDHWIWDADGSPLFVTREIESLIYECESMILFGLFFSPESNWGNLGEVFLALCVDQLSSIRLG